MVKLISDVDGVFFAHGLSLADPNVIEKDILFHKDLPDSKPMIRTETVKFDKRVPQFFHDLGIEITWLTGWKSAAPRVLDNLFDIKSTGFLDWDQQLPDEIGKVIAIQEFILNDPEPFIWLEDQATRHVRENDFLSNASCIITPEESQGLTLQDLKTIESFVNKLS